MAKDVGGRSTRRRGARWLALLLLATLSAPALSSPPEPEEAPAPKPIVRTARLSLRVEGDGRDARIEIPLPRSDHRQRVVKETMRSRGFFVDEVEREGNRIAVLTLPRFSGRKRITYEATVELLPESVPVQPEAPRRIDLSGPDAPWLRPTVRIQSASPLLRERLARFAEPRLAAGEEDMLSLAWELTTTGFEHREKGSLGVLKALRTGHASARGMDRLLVSFLRASGIPARKVLGLDLGLSRRKRLAYWAEVKTGGQWAPMSIARDLQGELPARFLKLSHGDRPFVLAEGLRSHRFQWKVSRPEPAEVARP